MAGVGRQRPRYAEERAAPKAAEAVRPGYEQWGVDGYYSLHGADYENPHESQVAAALARTVEQGWLRTGERVLDLCCGSGEVTRQLPLCDVTGLDPYTGDAYYARTGKRALELDFRAVAAGRLTGRFDAVVSSFALHLCPPSLLPALLWQLARVSARLIVMSPHKRPDCEGVSGWRGGGFFSEQRVRCSLYRHDSGAEVGAWIGGAGRVDG